MMTHVPNNPATARFAFDNTYARELEGFYVTWKAAQVARPRVVQFNRELAEELGLDAGALDSEEGASIFAGNETPEGAAPLAQAYAGHQFGGFSHRLGDGRALLLGEVIDRVDAVTSDEIRRVANELLVTGKLNMAVVGPTRGQRRLERLLKL